MDNQNMKHETLDNHLEASSDEARNALEQAWRIVNLQADTLNKMRQTMLAPWTLVVSGIAAGGGLVALVGGVFALLRLR